VDVVVPPDDDVAQIDPDTEYDPLPLGRHRVALGHPTLHRNRAGDGLYDAREFDQDTVAGGFDDAAFVLGNLCIDEFAAVLFESRQCAGLIVTHEPGITDNICCKNGGKFALYRMDGHAWFLPIRV